MIELKNVLQRLQIPETYEAEIEPEWDGRLGSAEFLAPEFIIRYGSMTGIVPMPSPQKILPLCS